MGRTLIKKYKSRNLVNINSVPGVWRVIESHSAGGNAEMESYNVTTLQHWRDAMINIFRLSVVLLGLSIGSVVFAANIEVTGAWARATLPEQDMGMASLAITSKQAATLIGISSRVCKSVEMHSMSHDNNMMQMREVNEITLPAGSRVDFSESGYHLMLIGLKAPLKEGVSVPLTLRIKLANRRVINVKAQAEVRPVTEAQAPEAKDEHIHHH